MAVVRIDSGALPSAVGVEGNDLMRVIGKWASIADGRFPEDCAALLQMVDETDRLRLWEKNIGGHTFKDRNEFLQRRVLIDFNLTEQSLNDIVTRLRKGETVAMRAQRIVASVKALAQAPTPAEAGAMGGRGHKASSDRTGFNRGESAAYLAARLKRDHQEIAERLARGEFRSIRAAAIEAGIITPPTPLDRLRKAWAKASDEERAIFRTEIEAKNDA
jgi:hypothetical protein